MKTKIVSAFRFPLFLCVLCALCGSIRAGEFLSGVSGTIAYGQNTDSGNNVYAIAATVPVSKLFAVSVIGANDGGRWLASAATLQLGDRWALTDRISVTANLGSGIAYDIETKRPTIYSFGDIGADYAFSKNFSAGGKVIIANLADRKGIDWLVGPSVSWKF